MQNYDNCGIFPIILQREQKIKMQLEPKDLYAKLEFDKVLELLEKECLGELGKEAIHSIKVETELKKIKRKLKEVYEYTLTFEYNNPFPIAAYFDLSSDLRMLEIEDYVLPEEGLVKINIVMIFIQNIFRFFTPERKETYPTLYRIIQNVAFDEDLIKAISKVIDEEGNIKADASPELLKIRRAVISKEKEVEKKFRGLIQHYKKNGWLTDNVESFRNGRRVLSVPAEHKRKIRGIIHDESATGKTSFIEPEGVIELNNDIFDLHQEEKREIYRLLKELSALLRPYIPALKSYQLLLIRFDIIQAKARVAMKMKANMPKMVDHPHFGILEGYHPLLLLKNQAISKETIPFDLSLMHKNRIVVLSGPNAGGKSITMKSVGLIQLMFQAGMLVPVDPESEMGVFKKIFADIGDQQSLEDDLSTYSSRLKNARIFIEKADDETLILIDEFGSGTDPKIGGAIAESILKELNFKKVFGVITTHYSNLKIYAFKNRGIVNGSMRFDKETLSPTYEFKVGRPGSSYAFEIAQKSGLQKRIIKYAQHRTGKNEKAVDQLLVDLQREKQELEERLAEVKNREQSLEKLIKNYEQMHRDLEFKRKKIKLDAKQSELQQVAKDNREFERLIKELKENQKLKEAKQKAIAIKVEREKLVEEVQELTEEIYYKPDPVELKKGPIQVGDYVKMKSGGAAGLVEAIDKNKAIVLMGQMRMSIKVRDLQHANAPLDLQAAKSISTDTVSQNSTFESRIDIRGMRFEEAMKVIEDFMDQALMSNAGNLRIIHGKGNGTLRKVVKKKLREYDVDMSISHPAQEFGGDGVTLVDIN